MVIRILKVCVLWSLLTGIAYASSPPEFQSETLDEIRRQLDAGELTSRALVEQLLRRVATLDHSGPLLRSIIEINPDALNIADALDKERRSNGPRGPLHGIPIVIKANIDTGDSMATSAGSLALAEHKASDDAALVASLRAAGMIIMAKTNLSEWANFRSTNSVSGWSSLGGQTRNPHVLDRNPCGSSSGSAVAVAAALAPLAVGTETDGSIICPSSINGIVGIKPTLGLVSRDGIIPIAHTQDTAGPMARSVYDAALLLGAMAVADASDPAASAHPGVRDYVSGLDRDALKGKRIGVWRDYFGAADNPVVAMVFNSAVKELEAAGATVIDPLELMLAEGRGDAEYEVLLYEFKSDLNRYLNTAGLPPELDELADLIKFNGAHAEQTMPWFGQEIFALAEAKGDLDEQAYLDALETSHEAMQVSLADAFSEFKLDAIVAPSNGPAWPIDYVGGDRFSVGSSSLAAVSGWPSVTLPAGEYRQLPLGISIIGRPWSEPDLLALAYALEQRLPRAPKPAFIPSIEAAMP